MNIKEIIDRNYAATVKRGLIIPETTKQEFIDKLYEEVQEFDIEADYPFHDVSTTKRERAELADVILVCFAYAKHFEIDILSELEKKVLFNEKRL